MPRDNSQDRTDDEAITGERLQDINQDIDDLYANGSDRLRVGAAASGSALKIDIGSGTYFVDEVKASYAGGTDITMTDDATNYVMIDAAGSIQISTLSFNGNYAYLAEVVCASGSIASITLMKPDVFGGSIGGVSGFDNITSVVYDNGGMISEVISNGITYDLTYDSNNEIATMTNGTNTRTVNRSNGKLSTIVKT